MLVMNRAQNGDTIIEVLLAVTMFSLVSVGAMTVMNQGMNSALRALEVTQVKQQIDSQAQALRAAQQSHFAAQASDQKNDTWTKITTAGDHTTGSVIVNDNQCVGDEAIQSGFAMNGRTGDATLNPVSMNGDSVSVPYSQVVYESSSDPNQLSTVAKNAYGLWIDKQQVVSSDPKIDVKAYDFTIHACWYGPGLNVPMTVQTVVRLYSE